MLKKNLLIQYKGGGYDGCFWEWNYFLFDSEGKFHVIAASGRNGIRTETDARSYLANGMTADDKRIGWKFRAKKNEDFYAYRLTFKKSLHEFQSECAATNVADVVAKVNEIYGHNVMYWKCDACSCKCYDADMYHDGYKGNGGIGVQMLGKLCMDCYSSGLCHSCGEYSSEDLVETDDEYCCKWCAESKQKEQSA